MVDRASGLMFDSMEFEEGNRCRNCWGDLLLFLVVCRGAVLTADH